MTALRKYHIPLPGAVLALLAFFLPWAAVGCQGIATVDASGYDLASGSLFEEVTGLFGDLGGTELPDATFAALWAIPVAAVVSAVLVYLTMRNPAGEKRNAVGHILLGAAGLAALALLWFQLGGSGGDSVAGLLTSEVTSPLPEYSIAVAAIGPAGGGEMRSTTAGENSMKVWNWNSCTVVCQPAACRCSTT